MPYYRCQECCGSLLLCTDCCVDGHAENPLHVIYRWTGVFFFKTSLQALGHHIQLGHPPRERCANPQIGHCDFVVLHDNGIHSVNVDFCSCGSAERVEPYLQLLRAGWYPASDERPQMVATFLLLDKFHLNTLQAKTTAYDLYAVLEQLTDNTGVKPPDRYQVFLCMARQYCHLLMLKQAVRSHDPSGVWGMAPGELVVECPVCPDPKVNLPEGFLYILFLALDACFRLKRRLISSEIKDPALGSGWHQKEMSTCSGLAALDYTNTKFSRGYSTTGVGMGVYARLRKIILYNIVCQWWKMLNERLKELPPLICITIILALFWFVIPKLHIHAHTLDCQVQFSLNLVPGGGQTDGKGIECPWGSIGAIASSTRASGPSARHDALDDHWNFWNWLKTIGLERAGLAARAGKAGSSLEDFKAGQEEKNPYQMKVVGMTEAKVRLKFATEEEQEAKSGMPALHDVTPSSFVMAGLDLEEEQRRVRVQAELKKAGTTAMVINMKALWGKLNRGIAKFRKLQATYTPAAIQALAKRVAPAEELAEDILLMLPSSLTAAEHEGGGCMKGVLEIEDSMHAAQCCASLPRLRNQLHIKSHFLLYKKHNARHQGMNMHSRTLIAHNENKIRLHSEKFQMAWRAWLQIADGDRTKVGWPELRREDIRCMQDAEQLSQNAEKRGKANERRLQKESEIREDGLLLELDDEDNEMVTHGGENMHEVSWIWTMAGMDEELEDGAHCPSSAWIRF
ncbi:hypothetical protein C8R45DRAFT_929627 [Mycena sanguinolenta]|nr:hypothetical protein C8R45DRAFT_929627 [Mycena sanguinolenta]